MGKTCEAKASFPIWQKASSAHACRPGPPHIFIGQSGSAWPSFPMLNPFPWRRAHDHDEYVLTTPQPADQFYLIVGSLADATRVTRIHPEYPALAGSRSHAPGKKSSRPGAGRIASIRKLRFSNDSAASARHKAAFRRKPHLRVAKPFTFSPASATWKTPRTIKQCWPTCVRLAALAQVYVDRADRNIPGMDKTIAEVLAPLRTRNRSLVRSSIWDGCWTSIATVASLYF